MPSTAVPRRSRAQNPQTQTLSEERMRALYTVAQKHNLTIIEDDAYYWIQMPGLDTPSKRPGRRRAGRGRPPG